MSEETAAAVEETKTKSGSPKLTKLVDEIGSLTVLELSQLVDTLKDKFNIQAVAVAAPAAGGAAAAGGEAAVEKTDFNIILADAGAQKLQVLKEVRAVTGLGLKEAKDLIDSLPGTIKEGASKEEAEEIKKKLESVGAKVELK